MKKLFFQTLILFFATIYCSKTHAQTLVNREWEQLNGIPDSIAYSTSILDTQGNLIVTSNAITAGQQANLLVMKYDRHGNLLWQDTYNGTFNGKDYGIAITTDNGNNIYVAGASQTSAFSSDYIIRKYKSDGTLGWTTNYSGSGIYNAPTAIALDNIGNVYVTGVTFSLTSQTDYATIKLNGSGVTQWVQTYDYANLYDVPAGIEVNTSNGNIYVTGASASTSNNYDYATLEYDATNGTQLNVNRVTAPGTGFDKATAIVRDNAGNIYITGSAFETSTNSYDIKTIKLNASLAVQWIHIYDKMGLEDVATTIGVDNGGNVFVGGYLSTNDEGKNFITLKYDPNGNLLWNREYNDNKYSLDDEIRKLGIDIQGNVTVTGKSSKGMHTDFVTLQYDTSGDIRWLEEFDGSNGNDSPTDIQIDNQGNIYVNGSSYDGSNDKNTVIRYSSLISGVQTVTDSFGTPLYLAHEIVVMFDSSALNKSMINDRDIQFGRLEDFLPSNIISAITQKLGVSSTRSMNLLKIHHGLTTLDTISIGRGGNIVRMPLFWTTLRMTLPLGIDEKTACDSLNTLIDFIHFSEPNYVYFNTIGADDIHYITQANLHPAISPTNGNNFYGNGNINIEGAWDREIGKSFVNVGVFDTGIKADHEDLVGRVKGGFDYTSNTPLTAPFDLDGHGTPCAGIIGASRNNHDALGNPIGIAGIAGGNINAGLEGCSLFNMRLANGSFVSETKIATAIRDGATSTSQGGKELHVMNMSFSNSSYSLAVYQAVRFAERNGVSVIASRGNFPNPCCTSNTAIVYPACYSEHMILSVGAAGNNGDRMYYSNGSGGNDSYESVYDNGVDVIAPGTTSTVLTTGTLNTSNYRTFNGTSAAAPHVAGLAALGIAYYNTLAYNNNVPQPLISQINANDIQNVIKLCANDVNSATAPGPDIYIGNGLIDADNTLAHLEYPYYRIAGGATQYTTTYTNPNSFMYVGNGLDITEGLYYVDEIEEKEAIITYNFMLSPNAVMLGHWVNYEWSEGVLSLNNPVSNVDLQVLSPTTIKLTARRYHISANSLSQSMDRYIPDAGLMLTGTFYFYDPYGFYIPTSIDKQAENGNRLAIAPNPCSNELKLAYYLNQQADIKITLSDVTGQVVQLIDDGIKEKGDNYMTISTTNIANGIYFVNLVSNTFKKTEKVIVIH